MVVVKNIAILTVTSPIVINVPTRGLLAVETKVRLFCGWQNLNIKDLFVNSEYRYCIQLKVKAESKVGTHI